jgi:hypothetical protein
MGIRTAKNSQTGKRTQCHTLHTWESLDSSGSMSQGPEKSRQWLFLTVTQAASWTPPWIKYTRHYWPIVPAPDNKWGWFWRNWWNEDWQGKPKYSKKTCPSATLSTTNPTSLDPGLNPGRRGGKPATNRLTYGAAPGALLLKLLYSYSTLRFFYNLVINLSV